MKFFTTERLILFAIILGLAIWLFSLRACERNKFSHQKGILDSVTLANQKMDSIINKQGQTIKTQAAIITDDKAAIKKLAEDNFDLKSDQKKRIKQYNVLLQQKTNTRIDSFEVAWVDTAAFKRFSDSVERNCSEVLSYYRDSFIKVPQAVVYDTSKNKDFQFSGTVKKTGFDILSANFPDTQDIAIYETKGGLFRRNAAGKIKFFSRSQLEVKVKHSNKYIDITGMNSIIYKPKKGIWTEVIAILAAAAGFYLGLKL